MLLSVSSTVRKQTANSNSAYGTLARKKCDITGSKDHQRTKEAKGRLCPGDRGVSIPSGPRSKRWKGDQRKQVVRAKFSIKKTTTVRTTAWTFVLEGLFFQRTQGKYKTWFDKQGVSRPKTRPTRKLCDRCGHRPNRRVKCRICKRAVGPCCLETEDPAPLCKDCWEPDPEQSKTRRDEVFQPEDSPVIADILEPGYFKECRKDAEKKGGCKSLSRSRSKSDEVEKPKT